MTTFWRTRSHRPDGSTSASPGAASDPDPLLLPPASRVLHIGPHKTGSTAIQVSLEHAIDELVEHGTVYFGRGRAVPAGLAIGVRGAPGQRGRPRVEVWDRFTEDVRAAGAQRVCISNEDFGRAEPDQVRRLVDGLGGDEPQVVAVVRRLDGLLPSAWQERVKVGSPYGYDEWLRKVLARVGEPCVWDDAAPWAEVERTNLWYAHDPAALVRRWADVVGPDRVTVIVADDRDRELLPRTFERLLGLPEGLLALHPDESNRSLQWGEVEFVRAINEALIARGVPPRKRRRLITRGVVRDLASRPRTGEERQSPPMPVWAAPVVQDLSAARSEAIASLGVTVVGDPATLRVDELPTGDATAPVVPAAVAARSVALLVGGIDT